MHQKISQLSKKVPIARKGRKYVAKSKGSKEYSVPVVIAVRDMLKLARNLKEVKRMISEKLLKINGREVRDYRAPINLFNIFEADKKYVLTFTKNGKFVFEETKDDARCLKIIGKKVLKGGKIQLNLMDGTNILGEGEIEDSVYVLNGKIKKSVKFEKGKEGIVISGKYIGKSGKIKDVEEKTAVIEINGKDIRLEKRRIVVR